MSRCHHFHPQQHTHNYSNHSTSPTCLRAHRQQTHNNYHFHSKQQHYQSHNKAHNYLHYLYHMSNNSIHHNIYNRPTTTFNTHQHTNTSDQEQTSAHYRRLHDMHEAGHAPQQEVRLNQNKDQPQQEQHQQINP